MRKVEFTKNFATRKKGDQWECGNELAHQLVNGDKVAKYIDNKSKKEE